MNRLTAGSAFVGLTDEQARAFREIRDVHDRNLRKQAGRAGWSIYRAPTTIHPPTLLYALWRHEDFTRGWQIHLDGTYRELDRHEIPPGPRDAGL